MLHDVRAAREPGDQKSGWSGTALPQAWPYWSTDRGPWLESEPDGDNGDPVDWTSYIQPGLQRSRIRALGNHRPEIRFRRHVLAAYRR